MKFRFRKKEEVLVSFTPLVVVAGLVAVLYLFRRSHNVPPVTKGNKRVDTRTGRVYSENNKKHTSRTNKGA